MVAQLAAVLTSMVDSAAAFLPGLIAAIILLIIGLVVGKIVGRVVKEVLIRINLDYYVFETHRPAVSLTDLFSVVARWWIYLAFIGAALSERIFGIPALAAWVSQALGFVGAIIGASVIILVAYALGEYIRSLFAKGGPAAAFAGKIANFAILYVAFAIALTALGLSQDLTNFVLQALAAGIALALALAIGLGSKDVAARWAGAWAKRSRLV